MPGVWVQTLSKDNYKYDIQSQVDTQEISIKIHVLCTSIKPVDTLCVAKNKIVLRNNRLVIYPNIRLLFCSTYI